MAGAIQTVIEEARAIGIKLRPSAAYRRLVYLRKRGFLTFDGRPGHLGAPVLAPGSPPLRQLLAGLPPRRWVRMIQSGRCGLPCGLEDMRFRGRRLHHSCYRDPLHFGPCDFTGHCGRNR
jgi:hypothetical protein